MKCCGKLILTAIFATALLPCSPPEAQLIDSEIAYQSFDITIASRGIEVPATYVLPASRGKEPLPLVVMAHGHGGTKDEAGSFISVAEGLARRGIASIRMDFPGCGDSSESFANNNISNMLDDIRAARDVAIEQLPVDPNRVGLFGWSMGGRLALLLAGADDGFTVIATWAPAASNGAGSMVNFLGGPAAYESLKLRAEKEGSVPFTTAWGQDQQLGYQWFVDMERSKPLQTIATFEGPLLVLYGDRDQIIPPGVPEAAIAAASSSSEVVRHVIKNADHGLGVFSGEPVLTQEAVQATVDFLSQRL